MISRADLNERVREWALREDVVEKDYAIGWVLAGIGTDPDLSVSWAFKGGTCLKKCYLETYRFSEDLDFTVLPRGPVEPERVGPILQRILARVSELSGVDFLAREPYLRARPDGESVEGRIYYRGPRNAPEVSSVKLDLTRAERIVRPTVLRPISHPYPDALPSPATVRCYGFEEVFGEKLRAMGERSRPRDLYDIVMLFRRQEFAPHAVLIREVYQEKCASKGIEVPNLESLRESRFWPELEREWENMLAHQLPALPPFEEYAKELPNLFAWLEGETPAEPLPAMRFQESDDTRWSPPSTAWVWGQGVALEPVRFAGTNRLCVELGYQGSTRIIEPYSLRMTRDGNLILHAVRHDSGETRSYRVDRIHSLRVTNIPYRPRYAIEFVSSGSLLAPPTTTRVVSSGYPIIRSPRVSRGRSRTGLTYVVECNFCQKRFYRSKYDTHLNPHKQKGSDLRCPDRIGYVVRSY